MDAFLGRASPEVRRPHALIQAQGDRRAEQIPPAGTGDWNERGDGRNVRKNTGHVDHRVKSRMLGDRRCVRSRNACSIAYLT